MKLERRTDWQARLDALVAERMCLPFAWGGNDCVTFAAEAVLQITGAPLLPAGVPTWNTAREAFRSLQPLEGLAGAVRSTGLEEIGPRLARRGDVVLLRAPGRQRSMRGALGICLGERIAAPGEHGLVMCSLAEGAMAWRV